MNINLRKLHRKIAPVLFLPLFLSAITGIGYRIGKNWFGLSSEFGDFMMAIHEGAFLGKPLAPLYIMLLGSGLVGMVITGITMIRREKIIHQVESKSTKLGTRTLHHFLAPIFFLPLIVSASTGIIYRLGKSWFSLSDKQAKVFLDIHQGHYLGSSLRAWYILYPLGASHLGISRNT